MHLVPFTLTMICFIETNEMRAALRRSLFDFTSTADDGKIAVVDDDASKQNDG